MFAKRRIRLKSIRNEIPQFTNTAFEMRADERDKLIARVGMHPYTVLQSDKAGSIQKASQLIPDMPPSF